MSVKLTKAEFEALPDALKVKFTADGDSYQLQEEDVEGLKKSKAEILAEKKKLAEENAELARFKAEQEAKAAEAEEAAMKEAGKFKELEERYKERIAAIEADKEKAVSDLKQTIFESSLRNLLAEKGVRAEMTPYALIDAQNEFELGDDLKPRLKNGIGDAKEIDGFVAKLKERVPDFFTATTQPGGGASGSGNGGSGAAKQWTREQWEQADTSARSEFSSAGGQVI